MMPCSLRSLLLAVIALSNCITWTASRHHFTHNASGHRSRHRRQGTGLFLSASYVLPGGEGSGWGDWGAVSPCSRTCGGGVASQKRICLQFGSDGQPQCTGGDTKYFSCETQDCPAGAEDFRTTQCAYYNNESFRGIKYKWEPYTKAPNPCELNCMPHGERFYYRHKSKVVDGTRCNDESFDVCVNGTCQPVGCDMMLGSNAREDKCRHCRGNGVNCHTTNGLLNTQDLRKGYNDMLLIPEGATSIYVSEVRPSNNYLALRAKNGTYYLNGDYHIDFPRSMVIAGVLWYYERSQQGFAAPDKLRCLGPTNEPLYLSLLLQDDNVGIEYEYSLPSELAPRPTKKYNWVHDNFTPCSVSCAGGFQTRNVTCRSSEELDIVDDGLCDEVLKPPTNQTCNTQPCAAQWVEGPWSQCSKRCGKGGTRSREIRCEKIITSGFPSIVSDKECFDILGPKPELYQECNVNASCPTWFVEPWKPCNKLCGEGKQTRQVICYQKNAGRIEVLGDEECTEEKPPVEQSCILQLCDGVDWVLTDWSGCDTCLSTVRTRVALCATKDHKVVNSSYCAYHPTPVLQKPCDVVPPCQVQWYATQWSKCSVECGKGVQSRQVFCGRFENEAVVIVNDSLCADLPKYNDTKPCEVPKEKCPSKWYASPWSACTKECGGGEQYRRVMCLRGNKPANDCSPDLVIDSSQICNDGPCNKDEILPLNPNSTPIMDEDEEDCVDEEDYPEVGLDIATSDFKTTLGDEMISDGPILEDGSGMEFPVSMDLDSTLSFADTGSGFELTSSTDDELFVEGLTKATSNTSDAETTETIDVSAFTTESTVTDFNTTDTDYESTETAITEVTVLKKKKTTLSSKSLITSDKDETKKTTVSSPTNESTVIYSSTETSETESTASSITDETGSTSSTETDETSDFTTESESDVTETAITEVTSDRGKTKKTTVSPPTSESSVIYSTTEPSEIESTASSITDETGSTSSTETDETSETETGSDVTETESTASSITDETGSTSSTETDETSETETGSDVTELTEVTDLKKKETTLSSESATTPDRDVTTKSTVPTPTNESTVIDSSTETSETESTASSITDETGSTSSTETDETSDFTTESGTSITESTITEVTDLEETTLSSESVTTPDKDVTTKSTVPPPTNESTVIDSSKETPETETTASSISGETGSTLITQTETSDIGDTKPTTETESNATETKVPKVTESSITTETNEVTTTIDMKSSEFGSNETSSIIESTKSTETSHTFETESTTTEGSTKLERTEETSETISTFSSITNVTSAAETVTSSTEPTPEKSTETKTESKEPSSTVEVSTVSATILETASSSETTSTSVPTKETKESVSGSTEPVTESTEPSSTTESSTIAAGITETVSSSETTQSTRSESVTVEKATETASTVSLLVETKSSTTESSTTQTLEETTEPSTTESASSSDESTSEFTELTTSSTEISTEGRSEETSPTTESITLSTQSQETSETTSGAPVQGSSQKTTEILPTEVTTVPAGTSIRDWKTAMLPTKPFCKKRKLHCTKTKFGCCPDRKTAAAGPFDEGCPKPKTCKESKFGCCPDEISPALGPKYEGCPIMPCAETLFGCCLSDNKTAAEGNDQEGCPPKPPACKSTVYGCCEDGETEATGPENLGCPEYSTTQTEGDTDVTTQKETMVTETTSTAAEGCVGSAFGCCFDNETEASGPDGQGCPCNSTKFGCCPDGVSPANGTQMEGCMASCNTSSFGCCPDGKTPAHGHGHEGCCLLYPFGCCPDNYKPAEGPHLEGCGCQYARFGCCPDNVTYARGPNNEGCGCQYSPHGCCPDRHTEASGPSFEGCGCHTYQFGCCPDGFTIAKGPGQRGCHCYQSKYGCCGDGETAASGPEKQGCDCSSSKYGCCPDGITEAKGSKFLGCTDMPLNRQAACSLSTDRGSCRNYSVHWYYDLEYGGCSRFWYGGCEGNGNRFTTKEECEDVCVQPSPQDTCKLPKVKGACAGYNVRWYYDNEREQCSQFVFGGCLGNANNFDSRELCQAQCEPTKTADQCTLPIDRGSCSGNFGRWGFNAETRRCEQFIWGGCEGNSNRFGSEAACVNRCDPPGAPKPQCTQPQDVGNCTDKEAMWSFSQSENRCVPFYYTGCGGNDNRFDNEQSCINACPSSYIPDLCTLPAETGDCANYRERWYFDTSEQRCRQFYYGGCGGNNNNFASQLECENRCSGFTTTTTVQPPELRSHEPDICQLPMLSGPCEDSIMRWFYDASIDACNQFTYGGCQGNDNRFETRDDCERRCRSGPPPSEAQTTASTTTSTPSTTVTVKIQNRLKEVIPQACTISLELEECTRAGVVWYYDAERRECVAYENNETGNVCRQTGVFGSEEACQRSCGAFRNIKVCRYSLDPGPCQNFVSKYYYNQTSGNCHEFAYGGCHGGPNRFSSFDECLQVCRPEMDPCKQGPEPGNCLERFELWYYDYYSDSCSRFTYTGCGGNDNRFETRDDCEGRCRQRPAVVTTTTTTIEIAHTTTTVAPTYTIEPTAEECRTPESLTPCGMNITAFYYDSTRKVCVESNIGACRYSNSYRSEEECERKCGAFKDIDVCEARLDTGPCHNSISKFYWDFASGKCQPYAYGGCGGGANRFSTIEECEEVCGSSGPGSNDVQPACSLYTNECARLNCAYGIEQRRDSEGCVRCSCKAPEVDCEPMRLECETLQCPYGIQRIIDENRCQRCLCYEDPCLGNNCTVGQQCVAIAYRDPVTREPHYSAQCRLITPEPPNCDRFNDECSRLQCGELGIQRVRTVEGCERCTCVPLQIDCEPLRHECKKLKCTYGMDRQTGSDGCERCRCTGPPCENKECPEGDRCVTVPYRDPITRDTRYSAECRTVNKTGYCPARDDSMAAGSCRRDCNDDADCRGVAKCCRRGCSQLCSEPDQSTVPTAPLPYTTTHKPDLPESPRVNHETEPEVTGTEGGKAILRCLFHGNPPPKITWTRGEITIDADEGRYRLLSDGALEIVSLYRNDSGVYICIADNGLGTARQEVHLQVKVAVRTQISAPQTTLTAGSELSLPCEVDGYPDPEVYWTKDNVRLVARDNLWISGTTISRLTIPHLAVSDSGVYGCHAGNAYSSHYSTVQINVQGLTIPAKCTDNPFFANCHLIVRSKFCQHKYYSVFCCKSCMEAGQLNPDDVDVQADQAWTKAK